MFKHLFTTILRSTAGRSVGAGLSFCLVLLALSSIRPPADKTPGSGGKGLAQGPPEQVVDQKETMPGRRHMTGAAARQYLQEPGEGQSLMQAITAARFGLKSQERGPFGEPGRGYLGTSHEQNLNAWFAEDGVTLRPTVAPQEREPAWHLEMRLKAYGYGDDLVAAPPIVSQQVKDNRIEYERGNFELRNANFELMKSDSSFISKSAIQNPKFIEWYENRAEGIEQGFTIGERPERNSAPVSDKPLRVVISLNGGLHAHATDQGRTIELTDNQNKPALSYSKLIVVDAARQRLDSHMEASDDGREITLVVEDRKASYPIVIDPIATSLQQLLDAKGAPGQAGIQSGAQFGDAVAIEGDRAIVGAWLDDLGGADSGAVYFFSRTGTTWTLLDYSFGTLAAGAKCGYSVAISNDKVVYGCPGANTNAGIAVVQSLTTNHGVELNPGFLKAGDFFGASVAIINRDVVVGAPATTVDFKTNVGLAYIFSLDSMLNATYRGAFGPVQYSQNARFGDAVAIDEAILPGDGPTVLIGEPGTNRVVLAGTDQSLRANDSATGDLFGQNVALSGNTAVIGAPTNDAKGTDSGAAYVFVRDASGQWTQQQKLTASDGRAGDLFSYYAVAIKNNMIVVGARRNDGVSANLNDNRGAVYIFTRNGTVWTEQTKLGPAPFVGAPGDEYGTSVGISNGTVIVGAPHAAASNGTANAGTTYIYTLDCTPPYDSHAQIDGTNPKTVCPGTRVTLSAFNSGLPATAKQWRKNGVNLPEQNRVGHDYVIDSATSSDSGVYDAFVSNACGGEISTSVTLLIHTFNLNPSSQNFSAAGSPGIINVTSTGGCAWTAVSNAAFVTITSGATGTAPSTVGFTVAANTGPNPRTGTLTIAGQTFTVTQDGAAPAPTPNVVQFSASNYSVQEDCTTVTVTVNRIGDTSGAASVDYHTADISAIERKDYITARGTLRFAAGETSKSFAILINEDSFVEGNETFSVNLDNPFGLSLGGPVIATVTITDDSAEAANPIDDPQNYVCQHYHDFLNRQPDASGLQFWTNQITACGTDQACIETRRINVSASFFLSIEFQDTGYLVERIYKAAYGDAVGNSTFPSSHQLAVPVVRLNEFLSDTQEIGLGVIVGQGNWQQQIEINKQALTAAFVQRAKFTLALPASMTAAQFVDTLNANAGNPLSTPERNQLVNDLSTNAKTRAQVLRAVAEDSDLNSAESNRAFVLMQYFGYLRRNPNDPQDADHTGYDFWLTKLNQFNGNYISAEMVRAFITSIEYRQRFGPQ